MLLIIDRPKQSKKGGKKTRPTDEKQRPKASPIAPLPEEAERQASESSIQAEEVSAQPSAPVESNEWTENEFLNIPLSSLDTELSSWNLSTLAADLTQPPQLNYINLYLR